MADEVTGVVSTEKQNMPETKKQTNDARMSEATCSNLS